MCGERLGAVLEGSVEGLYDARLDLVVGLAILGTDQGCHFGALLSHSPVVLHRTCLQDMPCQAKYAFACLQPLSNLAQGDENV